VVREMDHLYSAQLVVLCSDGTFSLWGGRRFDFSLGVDVIFHNLASDKHVALWSLNTSPSEEKSSRRDFPCL
jgi:hypothetical protein